MSVRFTGSTANRLVRENSLSSASAMSLCYWVRHATVPTGGNYQNHVCQLGQSGPATSGIGISVWDSAGAKVNLGTDSTDTAGTTIIVANRWYNIIWIKNGTSNQVFVDGTREINTTQASQNTDLGVGVYRTSAGTFVDALNGEISNLKIWEAALPAALLRQESFEFDRVLHLESKLHLWSSFWGSNRLDDSRWQRHWTIGGALALGASDPPIPGTRRRPRFAVITVGGNTYEESVSIGLSQGMSSDRTADLLAAMSLGTTQGMDQARTADLQAAISLGTSQGIDQARAVDIPASLALAISQAMAADRTVDMEASITLAASQGVSSGRAADLPASSSFALTAGVSAAADTAFNAGVALGAQLGVSMDRVAELNPSITIPAGLGIISASQLVAENAAAFGVSLSLASSLENIFNESMSVGLVAAMAASGQMDAQAAASYAVSANLLPSAQADLLASFVFGLNAGIAASNTAELQASIALLSQMGITCSGGTDEVVTSILRTLQVLAEPRRFNVPSEPRTLEVRPGRRNNLIN